jgi:uncharacterized membrane protein HdeD (DUF308 family)
MPDRPLPGASPWLFALRGVIGILIGLYMLLMPAVGLAAFVIAYGIFSLVDGAIAAIAALVAPRSGRGVDWWLLLGGVLSIGVGLLFLLRPVLSISVMSLLIAAWMVAVGLSTIISAIQYRKQISGEWLLVIAGIFAMGFGLYLLFRPILAIALLPIMIGAYALFWGILMLITAIQLWRRKVPVEGDEQTGEASVAR